VRDQANKTLDLFMTRIRKYSQTLPDTAQPPPGATATAAPRMGTPQPDSSSWTGWAISSFTNKLAAASGQMQATNGTSAAAVQRPSSVPPPATAKPSASTSLHPSKAGSSSRPANPFTASDTALSSQASSARASTDDFSTDWADAWEEQPPAKAATSSVAADDGDAWGADADAWPDDDAGAAAADPFAAPAKPAAGSAAAFDGAGEPDFAGWLEAQAQAKRKGAAGGAKALPKGLARAQRPGVGGAAKASAVGAAPPRKAVVPKKAAVQKEEEEEGWGDAWE